MSEGLFLAAMQSYRLVPFLFLILIGGADLWASGENFDPEENASRLAKAVSFYQSLTKKGPWPPIPKGPVTQGPKIVLGDQGERVLALRSRLEAEGYLKAVGPDKAPFFDDGLQNAVIVYQARNGLEEDGVVGVGTIDSLNISLEKRICQLQINRERFLGEIGSLPPKYIRVNVPSFRLDLIENHLSLLDTKVIIGRRDRKTPIFNDEITTLVVNPAWYVPRSIAVKDKLPHIQKDPEYLSKMDMKLYSVNEGEVTEVDPATVDWTSVTPDNFSYRFVQRPGQGNALGGIKFLFPNRYDVYLHDTPERALFSRPVRTFSSGCIRVEKPMELASFLIADHPEWDIEQIKSAINEGGTRFITLPQPFPIHMVYITAWVDDEGVVRFRDDIYRYDQKKEEEVCERF